MSLVFQVSEKKGVGDGFGATVRRFADADTFLCEAHHHLSVIVNMCILSNKIQLVTFLGSLGDAFPVL